MKLESQLPPLTSITSGNYHGNRLKALSCMLSAQLPPLASITSGNYHGNRLKPLVYKAFSHFIRVNYHLSAIQEGRGRG